MNIKEKEACDGYFIIMHKVEGKQLCMGFA